MLLAFLYFQKSFNYKKKSFFIQLQRSKVNSDSSEERKLYRALGILICYVLSRLMKSEYHFKGLTLICDSPFVGNRLSSSPLSMSPTRRGLEAYRLAPIQNDAFRVPLNVGGHAVGTTRRLQINWVNDARRRDDGIVT